MALVRLDGALTHPSTTTDNSKKRRDKSRGKRRGSSGIAALPTAILLLGAVYCLLPVA